MNGREALKALADGKKVRRNAATAKTKHKPDWRNAHAGCSIAYILEHDDWEVLEQPATDEELIAKMERMLEGPLPNIDVYNYVGICRDMLRERSVSPKGR